MDGVVVGGCVDVDVLDVGVVEEVLEDAEACGVAGEDVGEFVDVVGCERKSVEVLEAGKRGGGEVFEVVVGVGGVEEGGVGGSVGGEGGFGVVEEVEFLFGEGVFWWDGEVEFFWGGGEGVEGDVEGSAVWWVDVVGVEEAGVGWWVEVDVAVDEGGSNVGAEVCGVVGVGCGGGVGEVGEVVLEVGEQSLVRVVGCFFEEFGEVVVGGEGVGFEGGEGGGEGVVGVGVGGVGVGAVDEAGEVFEVLEGGVGVDLDDGVVEDELVGVGFVSEEGEDVGAAGGVGEGGGAVCAGVAVDGDGGGVDVPGGVVVAWC